jgi:hypothetical protein
MAPGASDGAAVPPRVVSPPPLPSNPFTSSMHTFVHGCSWGSFGNLAGLGGSPFGSATNLAALGAAAAAGANAGGANAGGAATPSAATPGGGASGASTPSLPPAHPPAHPPLPAKGAASSLKPGETAARQHAAAAAAAQLTPPAPQARRATSFLRAVFSEPSLNGTSA